MKMVLELVSFALKGDFDWLFKFLLESLENEF
jgi:hypothetical protein